MCIVVFGVLCSSAAKKLSGKRCKSTLAVSVEQRRIFEEAFDAQLQKKQAERDTAFLFAVKKHEHITK
ncbi:MAG: hypothetical protein SGPRY_001565, partial [Prymnesium sp.]